MENKKLAAVCMHAEPGNVERNLERIRQFTLEASAKGAAMVSFPELSVTGYMLQRPEEAYRRGDHREVLQRIVSIAQEADVVLIAGLVEPSDAGLPFISQAVAGPGGLLGIHRKTHLSPPEKTAYRAGEEIRVFSWGSTVFGVLLCYEAHFPELATLAALAGAEVLFVPHASPGDDPEGKFRSWMRHLPARAFDNGLFVVVSNQVGKAREGLQFPGVAIIMGPDGRPVNRYVGEEECILYGELDTAVLKEVRHHRMKYFIPFRRPELYGDLLER